MFENEWNLWLENLGPLSISNSLDMPNCEKISYISWLQFQIEDFVHFLLQWTSNSNQQLTNNSDFVSKQSRQNISPMGGILSLIGVALGWRFLYVRQVGDFEIISSNHLFMHRSNNAWRAHLL